MPCETHIATDRPALYIVGKELKTPSYNEAWRESQKTGLPIGVIHEDGCVR